MLLIVIFQFVDRVTASRGPVWGVWDEEYLSDYRKEFGALDFAGGFDFNPMTGKFNRLRGMTSNYRRELNSLIESSHRFFDCCGDRGLFLPKCSIIKDLTEYPNYSFLRYVQKIDKETPPNNILVFDYGPSLDLKDHPLYWRLIIHETIRSVIRFKPFMVITDSFYVDSVTTWKLLLFFAFSLFAFAFGLIDPIFRPFKRLYAYIKTGRF